MTAAGVLCQYGASPSGKRVCLARALLRDTDVLILDEPLANLDGGTAERIEDLLSISDRTLLVVSHRFSEDQLREFTQAVDLAKNARPSAGTR